MDRIEWLTVDEAAEAVKLSESTIKEWIHKGLLPAYQVGGKWRAVRIARHELDATLIRFQVQVPEPGPVRRRIRTGSGITRLVVPERSRR